MASPKKRTSALTEGRLKLATKRGNRDDNLHKHETRTSLGVIVVFHHGHTLSLFSHGLRVHEKHLEAIIKDTLVGAPEAIR